MFATMQLEFQMNLEQMDVVAFWAEFPIDLVGAKVFSGEGRASFLPCNCTPVGQQIP